MSRVKLFIGVVLVALVLLFAVQNAATVDIQLLFWSFAFPRSLLLFLVLLVGFVAGWFVRSALKLVSAK